MKTELQKGREIGDYRITFLQGNKKEEDYIVCSNGAQITDKDIFAEIHKLLTSREQATRFLKLVWKLGEDKNLNLELEGEIFNFITKQCDCVDDIKYILYVIWHRLIIDEINYPSSNGLNGKKRLMGQIYVLVAKQYGFELYSKIKSLPEEVYLLGFPEGVMRCTITKEEWNEIFQLYENFIKQQTKLI